MPTKRARAALVVGLLLYASAARAASLTLAWDPNAPGTVDGYRLLYGPSCGMFTTTLEAGNITQLLVPNLTSGQTYCFGVVAYAGPLTSGLSNTVVGQAVDPACNFPLGAKSLSIFPTALQKTGSGGAGSKARIDFQMSSPGSRITHIAIRTMNTDIQTMDGTDLGAIAGMWVTIPAAPGTYTFSIFGSNDYGCSHEQLTTFSVKVP